MQYFVIGERELVLGFALIGINGAIALNRSEALESFKRCTGQKINVAKAPSLSDLPKVLILTEEISDMLQDEVFEWQKKGNFPLIVEIPGLQGHLEGRKTMTDAIREAVGVHV